MRLEIIPNISLFFLIFSQNVFSSVPVQIATGYDTNLLTLQRSSWSPGASKRRWILYTFTPNQASNFYSKIESLKWKMIWVGILDESWRHFWLTFAANALEQMMKTMGNVYWQFNPFTCKVEKFGVTLNPPSDSVANITCDCNFPGNVCHVTSMYVNEM